MRDIGRQWCRRQSIPGTDMTWNRRHRKYRCVAGWMVTFRVASAANYLHRSSRMSAKNNIKNKILLIQNGIHSTHEWDLRPELVFSFPGSRFPGAPDSRPFSFPDFRELKRRHSWEKRERVKDNCSLNETPDSYYSAFKRQLLVS